MTATKLNVFFDIYMLFAFGLKRGKDLGLVIFEIDSAKILKLHFSLMITNFFVVGVSGSPIVHAFRILELAHLPIIHEHVLHGFGPESLPYLYSTINNHHATVTY